MGAISDEVLSIVREMSNTRDSSVTLPSQTVAAIIARIDRQDKLIRAYRVLVACYDNLRCGVDKTAVESERLIGLEAARQIVAELEN